MPPPDRFRDQLSLLKQQQKKIVSDLENLRQHDNPLRANETRLREAHPQPCPVAAGAASGGTHELDAAWEKYHRSRALLEAERRALCSDRVAYREDVAALKQREEELKRRETWVAARELAVKSVPPPPPERPTMFTSAPFQAAREMLGLQARKPADT